MAVDLLSAWRSAPLAEVAWLDGIGRPQVSVVVPLMWQAAPGMALTYDRQQEAEAIATSRSVVLCVAALTTTEPVSRAARLQLATDPDGERFQAELLAQELAKHPPSRKRADSLLLRSEHWWFLPRLLLSARLEGTPVERHRPGDALAAGVDGERLIVTTCDLREGEPDPRGLPDGPAIVLQHGASLPDLEERWARRWFGEVTHGRFVTERVEGSGPRERPRSLWTRWREEVRLEKACRRALAHTPGR